MINCLIADDEQHSIDVLAHFVNQTDFLHLVATVTDASKALSIFNDNKIDLLFQDIHMPDLSGIDLVKAIQGKCDVIFTTAYPQYAIDGFELGVVDYLLKPISYPRFIKAIQKVIEKSKNANNGLSVAKESKDDFIYIKTGVKNSIAKIVLSEIDYFESQKNYVAIHHAGKETLVYISMKELISSLPQCHFIRVHRSFVVSVLKILKVEGGDILLNDVEFKIPLGDTYRQDFWELVNNKLIG